MMTAQEIRQTFLDFFQQRKHQIVPSAPIVIKNDPTLLFTNAGMNQFKDLFLGNTEIIHPRVADTQKCLRVSGKHNDLEEVGLDTYHHTMFEMLGNWSFGDYFKEEAITWAWELLTQVYKIPADRLYVTVFGGDKTDRLSKDEEAFECWKKHISGDRIVLGSKKDNFWEMGAVGPCGPSSEIHIDCRTEKERKQEKGAALVNTGHPKVIELWNLVFMEFNRLKNGKLVSLPAKNVDTGMGLERLVSVLQHKASNYDTDLFTPLIQKLEQLTGKKYDGEKSNKDIAFRVIADHIRAVGFAIADGQLPSNTGAGYVIRRILRRAVRYYFSFFNIKKPLLFQLTDSLAACFNTTFPELKKQAEFVKKVIREEEAGFLRTLESGIKKMDGYFASASTKEVDGKTAFELYDTYGFPFDLTRLIAGEKGYTIDEKGFKQEMRKQKERSRKATALDSQDWIDIHPGTTSHFVGYNDLLVETKVLKYRKIKSGKKEQYQIVLETTPFYAESGGQVGDRGSLKIGKEEIPVLDTKKENELTIHYTPRVAADMQATVTATVNMERRLQTMYNHTATHLLHAALKEVLGKHVNQKGSLVSPDLLRFDLSHFSRITDEEIHQIEMLVNKKIRENIPVTIAEMPKSEALRLGAMALFGEKYGDMVRVVTIDPNFSIELCGGTHVAHTGMIGVFSITSESAIAAGVRRIEALTGSKAMHYIIDKIEENKAVSILLKSGNPVKAIEKLLEEKNLLEKTVEQLRARQRNALVKSLTTETENINGVSFIGKTVEVAAAGELKKICFDIRTHLKNYVVILAATIKGKAMVALLIDEKLVKEKNWDAAKMIKELIAPVINGGGGGQKSLATAGGKDNSRLPEVIEMVKKYIR